jgi:hypothetical protein
MITAVVLAPPNLDALVRTLGALVPAVAQGLIGDALVVTRVEIREAAEVAEAVGATCLVAPGDPWFAAAGLARRDWLLCLESGDVPADGWIEAVGRLVSAPGGARLGLLSRRAIPRARWADLSETVFGATRVRGGHLVHRAIVADGRLTRRCRPMRVAAAIERPRG